MENMMAIRKVSREWSASLEERREGNSMGAAGPVMAWSPSVLAEVSSRTGNHMKHIFTKKI